MPDATELLRIMSLMILIFQFVSLFTFLESFGGLRVVPSEVQAWSHNPFTFGRNFVNAEKAMTHRVLSGCTQKGSKNVLSNIKVEFKLSGSE